MIIPPERLAEQTLKNLLEEFITREGTDYGMEEVPLEAKLQQLKQQLVKGSVLIWFDVASESTQLISQEEYQQLPHNVAGNETDDFSS